MAAGRARHTRYRLIRRRMKRTLGYGQFCNMDQLSMPMTEAATSYFSTHCPFDYLDPQFASKLSREACIDPSCLVLALVYLERLRSTDKKYFESTDPAHLYLSALMVASKYLHDDGEVDFIYNDEWAQCTGLDKKLVNKLELEILMRLDWRIMVDREEFEHTLEQLETIVCTKQFSQGYRTYAQLQVLLNWSAIYDHLIRPLCVVVGVACVTYTCGVGALLCAVQHKFLQHTRCALIQSSSQQNLQCSTHSLATHTTKPYAPSRAKIDIKIDAWPLADLKRFKNLPNIDLAATEDPCCELIPNLAVPLDTRGYLESNVALKIDTELVKNMHLATLSKTRYYVSGEVSRRVISL